MSLLVIDIGTSSVRASVVRPDGSIGAVHHEPALPSTPFPGLVEFDAVALAAASIRVASATIAAEGHVEAVGIVNQRASTVLWDSVSGDPVGPGIGWQDLRTVGTCLELQAQGFRIAPNASATKLAALLDSADADRERASAGTLRFGTVDSWIAWNLSHGALHVTDTTNAGVTSLLASDAADWDDRVLDALRIPRAVLPTVVPSSGIVGPATALPGAPPIAGIAGDQQASLVGQGCLRRGLAKATFGTGGMLDQCTGVERVAYAVRGDHGTFPVIAWARNGALHWAVEAIMLSAGTCVEWLRDDIGLIGSAAESEAAAASCTDTGDVWFVPALLGLGTPVWDFGARGTFVGITRGTGRAEMVRAVLEGIAHRGADLLEAAEGDTGLPVGSLRVDGGMTQNSVFVQALADACGRPIEVAPVVEATTLGGAYLTGLAVGTWRDEAELESLWSPRLVVDPGIDEDTVSERRSRWLAARARAEATVPELSALDF